MKQKSKGTEKGRNKENKNKVFVRKTNNYFSASLAVFLYYSSILSFFLSFFPSFIASYYTTSLAKYQNMLLSGNSCENPEASVS